MRRSDAAAAGRCVVATKSGTNQFHGSAYEFNRNNDYNANTFTDRASIAQGSPASAFPTPVEHYNDFGFTIGGPLFIPKVYHPDKDKTFFFWSEEWRKANTPDPQTFTVPTAAELGGSFTGPIPIAPAGCVTTAGGTSTISPTCFSKNAQAYLNAFMGAYPANANGQLVTDFSQLNNFREDNIRLDQNIGDKIRLYRALYAGLGARKFPVWPLGFCELPGS